MAPRLIQSVINGMARASAARVGARTLCARGIPSTATGGISGFPQAPCFNHSVHLPLYLSGARHMATFDWDKKLPLWMYGSIHDPEVVFHRLKVDDKEVLQLVQLMVADAIAQMKDDSTVGRELLMAELAKISDTQRYQDNFNCCLLVFFGLAGSTIYFETEKLKVQMVEITGNLTANAGEIVAELAEAIKHACPFFLGGHPFVFKQKWLKPKDANEGGGAPKEGGGAPKEGGDAQEGGDAPEEGWVSLIWRKCVGRKDAKEVGDAPIDGAKN